MYNTSTFIEKNHYISHQARYTVLAPHFSPFLNRHMFLHSSLPAQFTYLEGSIAIPDLAPLAGTFLPSLVISSGTSSMSPV